MNRSTLAIIFVSLDIGLAVLLTAFFSVGGSISINEPTKTITLTQYQQLGFTEPSIWIYNNTLGIESINGTGCYVNWFEVVNGSITDARLVPSHGGSSPPCFMGGLPVTVQNLNPPCTYVVTNKNLNISCINARGSP